MKCPKKNCTRKAQESPAYGVLPCKFHMQKDAELAKSIRRHPFFDNPAQAIRIQESRDKHGADIEQPWQPNGKPNEGFIKANPKDVAETYFSNEELEAL